MATNNPQLLRYPMDLADRSSDWVKFDFYKYQSAFGSSDNSSSYVEEYNKIEYSKADATKYPSIAMYMPEDISANYAGTWGGREFHPIAAGLMRGSSEIMKAQNAVDVANKAGGAINKMMGSIYNSREGIAPYLGAEGISTAINRFGFGGGVTANDVLASSQGRILNPNTEVLYQGPQLRSFGLTFKLTARNEKESDIIYDICRTFKRAALPSGQDDARNLISLPHIVEVSFMHKNDKSKWVSQFKKCAIGSVDVNYTPDGTWSTFRTGAPTAVVLTLQFQELKLIYADDLASNNY